MKFEKNYELVIKNNEEEVCTITPPIQISFNGTKDITSKANTANFTIYNLSEETRKAILNVTPEKNLATDTKTASNEITNKKAEISPVTIDLRVGYLGNLNQKFTGTISSTSIRRNGKDITTTITATDGGLDYQYSYTSTTVMYADDMLDIVSKDLKTIRSFIINQAIKAYRPVVVVGNTMEMLRKYLKENETLYVLNNKIYIIDTVKEYVNNSMQVISPETGLLSVEEQSKNVVKIETILNPLVQPGCPIKLVSTVNPELSNNYRVDSNSFDCNYQGSSWKETYTCTLLEGMESI